MEQIVRPFQSSSPASTQRIAVSTQKVAVKPAHLCWGAVGTLPKAIEQADTFNGINFRLEECSERLGERNRQTENVRVENPQDSNQFVIVQRIRSMEFDKTSKAQFGSAVQTNTLNLQFPDLWAGTAFSSNSEHLSCRQKMYFNR